MDFVLSGSKRINKADGKPRLTNWALGLCCARGKVPNFPKRHLSQGSNHAPFPCRRTGMTGSTSQIHSEDSILIRESWDTFLS
jgi:hypothetical protein